MPALAELGALSKEELDVELLPRVCGVCLATTSAPVRTAAVQAMGRLVKLVDENQAIKMLTTCQQARLQASIVPARAPSCCCLWLAEYMPCSNCPSPVMVCR